MQTGELVMKFWISRLRKLPATFLINLPNIWVIWLKIEFNFVFFFCTNTRPICLYISKLFSLILLNFYLSRIEHKRCLCNVCDKPTYCHRYGLNLTQMISSWSSHRKMRKNKRYTFLYTTQTDNNLIIHLGYHHLIILLMNNHKNSKKKKIKTFSKSFIIVLLCAASLIKPRPKLKPPELHSIKYWPTLQLRWTTTTMTSSKQTNKINRQKIEIIIANNCIKEATTRSYECRK